MSMHTKVVVFSGSPSDEDTARIFAALTRFAEESERGVTFEHITEFFHPYTTSGFGDVFIGAANYLDPDRLFETLRDAAQNPAWSSDYAPLVVILRHDEADHMPRTRTLDADGNWHETV